MKSYLVPEAVLNRFLSDFESGIVSYSFSETGSGGDVRYWGVDNDHELVAEVINFFQEGAAFPHFKRENVTAMYNVVPAELGVSSGDGWHFDSARKQFKCFCYLTDVEGPEDGAICFLRFQTGSGLIVYKFAMLLKYLFSRSNRIPSWFLRGISCFSVSKEYVCGPKGFSFIEDTSLPHKGGECARGSRHALTLYYFDEAPDWLKQRLAGE